MPLLQVASKVQSLWERLLTNMTQKYNVLVFRAQVLIQAPGSLGNKEAAGQIAEQALVLMGVHVVCQGILGLVFFLAEGTLVRFVLRVYVGHVVQQC